MTYLYLNILFINYHEKTKTKQIVMQGLAAHCHGDNGTGV